TAAVNRLTSGASDVTPLACSITGSGTLALARMPPTTTARPNAAIPKSSLMLRGAFSCGSIASFFSRCRCQSGPAPRAGLSVVSISINSLPPSPVPLQFEANVEIRIGADISARGVVHVGVDGVARGDVVSLRGRQCARSGGEDDGQSKCG